MFAGGETQSEMLAESDGAPATTHLSCSAVQLLRTTMLARWGRKHDAGRRELWLRHRQRPKRLR